MNLLGIDNNCPMPCQSKFLGGIPGMKPNSMAIRHVVGTGQENILVLRLVQLDRLILVEQHIVEVDMRKWIPRAFDTPNLPNHSERVAYIFHSIRRNHTLVRHSCMDRARRMLKI